ncbi:MAG TPA: KR domain-containing protein, partial [Mycobacterium sp.]|nr:KR domain-containing protein [Mycobacterium sp.]
VFSTTGADPVFDADYWAVNLRNPVRFGQAVAAAGADHGTFIEVSPHPLLTYAIDDTLADTHHHSVATLQRDAHDTVAFHTNLNATHTVDPPDTDHPPEPHPDIPTTPWQHTHHWLTVNKRVDAAGSAPRAGTLLGEHIVIATKPPAHLWQARLVPKAKPYPGFHRIQGLEVVPASVLLQTVLAAAAERGVSALADIRFEQPVVVDRPRAIQVLADGQSVTVSSSSRTEGATRHWVGHVSAQFSPLPAEPDTHHDGFQATDHQQDEITGGGPDLVAELLEASGVEGQAFGWTIEALKPTPVGVVADVSLTEVSAAALLDAAVHVARLVDGSKSRLMVPSGAESVRLGAALTDSRGRVEVCRRPGNADEIVVDIAVMAPDGATCFDIHAFRYVDLESSLPQASSSDTDPRSIAHAIEWQPWPEEADTSAGLLKGPGPVAVVGAESGAERAELQDRLATAGYSPAETAEARYVVYLAEPRAADADIDAAVQMSTEVADLVRLLADRDDQHPATLWIITRGVHEADSAAALPQSCLWGIAHVIAAEQPQLCGGLIDLPAGGDIGDFTSALSTVLPRAGKPVLVLRDGEFRAPVLVPVSDCPPREPSRCRPDAAYLITGGLGALGLLMSDWLADRGARRLILAGRTALPHRCDWDGNTVDTETRRKITAIRALEMRGVTVDVVPLDIGSPEAVQELLARRNRDGAPPIRGVLHAAGITENRLLTDTADSLFRRVMWPKVAGGQALQAAFPPGDLDFFFLTASAGTVFGVPGQGAYAAANAYLDCLARARHRQGCHTVSLDWVAWQGLGFASDAAIAVQELQRLGSRPVTPEEAFAAWEHADSYDVAQAVMAPLPSTESNGQHPSTPVRAWSAMSGDDLLHELEVELRTLIARELRLPETEVEGDRPFAELGLNSVMAMSIRREAEQLVEIQLSATMLWNYPTVTALAGYLAKRLSPEEDAGGDIEVPPDSGTSVLDALFDSAESVS